MKKRKRREGRMIFLEPSPLCGLPPGYVRSMFDISMHQINIFLVKPNVVSLQFRQEIEMCIASICLKVMHVSPPGVFGAVEKCRVPWRACGPCAHALRPVVCPTFRGELPLPSGSSTCGFGRTSLPPWPWPWRQSSWLSPCLSSTSGLPASWSVN